MHAGWPPPDTRPMDAGLDVAGMNMLREPSRPALPLGVLVVDDESWVAEELADGLRDAGFPVRVAQSAAEALRRLASEPEIGVVVTDLRMPGEDGLSLARRLLEDRRGERALRLVVMTGHATIDDATAAVRTGVFDFLRKPFALDEMLAVVGTALDAAAREREEAALRHSTMSRLAVAEAETETLRGSDSLTGLPNRAVLLRRLASLPPGGGALVVAIERIAAIAEGAGHDTADAALREAARRMLAVIPDGCLVARTGDAALAAILPDITEAEMHRLGCAVLAAIAEPMRCLGHSVALSASLGFVLASERGATPPEMALEAALAAARRMGAGAVVGFTPAMHAAAARRMRIEHELRDAVALGQLALHYQAVADPQRLRPYAFEALMRWHHPALGPVPPAEFIPLAEENGTILDLGAMAIAGAACQAAAWRGWIAGGRSISVNVSARQLMGADVPRLFARALEAERLPHTALVAELTESFAAGAGAVPVLRELRRIGLRVALDDFGVGYSSLGMLRELPVDIVKFDRSLVANAALDPPGRQLLLGMAGMVGALGLKVVVEGIETPAQLAIAAEAGCAGVQGYLVGRPLPAADIRLPQT